MKLADLTFNKETYHPLEAIFVEGYLLYEDSTPVIGAEVSISLVDTNIATTINTDETGEFSTSIAVPSTLEEGGYLLYLNVTDGISTNSTAKLITISGEGGEEDENVISEFINLGEVAFILFIVIFLLGLIIGKGRKKQITRKIRSEFEREKRAKELKSQTEQQKPKSFKPPPKSTPSPPKPKPHTETPSQSVSEKPTIPTPQQDGLTEDNLGKPTMSFAVCPYCSNDLDEGASFCQECGQKMPKIR